MTKKTVDVDQLTQQILNIPVREGKGTAGAIERDIALLGSFRVQDYQLILDRIGTSGDVSRALASILELTYKLGNKDARHDAIQLVLDAKEIK